MSEPGRRERRRTLLDVSVVPVEQALLARAAELDKQAEALMNDLGMPVQELGAGIRRIVACEFRALAEELHWR